MGAAATAFAICFAVSESAIWYRPAADSATFPAAAVCIAAATINLKYAASTHAPKPSAAIVTHESASSSSTPQSAALKPASVTPKPAASTIPLKSTAFASTHKSAAITTTYHSATAATISS